MITIPKNIFSVGTSGLSIIKEFEGLRLNAYVDPASGGEPITIGFGTTRYLNGVKVKLGDKITEQQAEQNLIHYIDKNIISLIRNVLQTDLNQNQYDAVISLIYNIGFPNFKKSTLLKKINANPNDTSIRNEFLKWVYASGKKLTGLVRRRNAEANLYFSTSVNYQSKKKVL